MRWEAHDPFRIKMGDASQSHAKPFLSGKVLLEMIKQHILVVDDNAAIRDFLKVRLEYSGHTVELAENGREGLVLLGHADYDLVLLDFMMPEITGLTVLQHIQELYPSLPVVMLTGHTDCHMDAQAIAAGARACLYKPFNWVELEDILRCSVGTAS